MKRYMVIAAFCVLGMTGCNQHIENFENVYQSREPIVTQSEVRLDVAFDYKSRKLSRVERERINDFIIAHDVSYDDDVLLKAPRTKNALSEDRVRRVAAYLRGMGIRAVMGEAQTGDAMQTVQVAVVKYAVRVPDCPNWSGNNYDDFNNQVLKNFGCADASNLALMIENPRDLIRGRDLSPADPVVLSNAYDKYRQPRVTAAEAEQAQNAVPTITLETAK